MKLIYCNKLSMALSAIDNLIEAGYMVTFKIVAGLYMITSRAA